MWGCLAKVSLPPPKRTAIGPKTYDVVFIGYAQNSVAYRFMSLKDSTIYESQDAEFFEHIFPLKRTSNTNVSISSNVACVPLSLSSSSSKNEYVVEPRKGKRQITEKDFGPNFITAFFIENLDKLNEQVVSAFLIEEDPKSYKEVVTSIDASFWKDAIKSELDSISINHNWDLVELPKGHKPIKCKWIFRMKLRPDGTIDKFQARLMVVGYAQKKDIDYFDTYFVVTKIATIRTLVALAAIYKLVVHQMDVKTTFLNGDLDEEIYIWSNLKVFCFRVKRIRCVNLEIHCMVLNKLQNNGIRSLITFLLPMDML